MKDSGIEWIGEIPEDWEVTKLKRFVKIKSGDALDKKKFIDNGDIEVYGANAKLGNYDKSNIDKESIITGRVGTIGTLDIKANVWITDNVLAIDVFNANLKFIYYFLHILNLGELSSSTAQPLITATKLLNINIAFPTSINQNKISNYLDKKTKQIEDVKNTISKEIETLENYKKSVITEAVTKGLDKNVEMKDSEIDWVGQIPVHWNLRKLKFSFKFYAGGDIDNSDFSPVETQIHKYPILANSLENKGVIGYMSKYRFKENTITVTGRGEVGVAYPRFMKYFPVVRLLVGVPITKIDVRYSSYCINSFIVVGEQTAMTQLTTSKIGEYTIPNPSFEEQIKIADYLDNKCQIIDETISLKQKQLETLEEYKKSLIYEYVTGKKEVNDGEET
ncbi:MAG: restriction endonuclease subunit S [Finegoldia magna]|nr:restriction endonuclease subunit S [Finegoldia magna]